MTTMMIELLVALVAVLVVHEAGHAVAAQALRLPWRLTLTRHGPGVVIGRDDLMLTPRQLVVTAAAGPAANLALLLVAVFFGWPLIGLLSLEFAVINLLPFPRSDGSRILHPARALAAARGGP